MHARIALNSCCHLNVKFADNRWEIMIVVIPSAREIQLKYLEPLIHHGARFIVVDDSPGRIRIEHPQFQVFNQRDQERILGDLAHAIPRRTGSCRDFGFFLAWLEADDDEVIVALDDDCLVSDPNFASSASRALSRGSRPLIEGNGKHWNVLDLYSNVPAGVYPRGFPYSERATYRPFSYAGDVSEAPLFHLGMWRGVFDINAIDKLQGPAFVHDEAMLRHEAVIVPKGVLVSVCAMNMVFRPSVVPAVYQLPMHVPVMPDWVLDRYGDIWAGFILKILMDRRGDLMSVGDPMIVHLKEGNLQRNIWQEHIGHLVNNEMIELLERAAETIGAASYLDMVDALSDALAGRIDACSPLLATYLKHLFPPWRAWVKALRRKSC